MKAAARQAGIAITGSYLACALSTAGLAANLYPLLPTGLSTLPQLGEVMQRDIHSGLALSGFDPVAYFLGDTAVPGRPEYELSHDGAIWRFASAANRDAFRESPQIYTPRFAAFDASAVAEGRAVDADPRRFAVIGSRLYFFRNEENRRRFLAEVSLRAKAQERWPVVTTLVAR